LGFGALGPIPNPQSPIPNPQSPLIEKKIILIKIFKLIKINKNTIRRIK
jgi:hypothetical protein